MRLINADALYENVEAITFNEVPVAHQPYVQAAFEAFDVVVRMQPTIDAEPVRHGRWIHDVNNLYGCSECRVRETMSHRHMKNYCPNCGAKMDVEE